MTEVDTTMPEGNTLPPASLQVASSQIAAANNALASALSTELQLKAQQNQNGSNSESKKAAPAAQLEVDGVDTEEDDSQITSSTDNGGDGADSKELGKASKRRTSLTSTESSKESLEADSATVVKTAVPASENSLNDHDGDSEHCNSFPTKAVDEGSRGSGSSLSKPIAAVIDADEDSSLSDKQQAEVTVPDVADPVSVDGTSNANGSANDDVASMGTTKLVKEKMSASLIAPMSPTEDPFPVDATRPKIVATTSPQKENGLATSEKKLTPNDTSIVDLGDDTDEEMEAVPKKGQPQPEETSNGDVPALQAAENKRDKSACSDSDGAVVIGSDSENEASSEVPVPQPKAVQPKPAPQIIEDDDDDCVVIEDDTPAPAPGTASDLSKRKMNTLDVSNSSDDSQPPNKRQRGGGNATLGQITIKDARSLLPTQDSPTMRAPDGGIYPINIVPAQGTVQGPPKLVPMSNSTSLPMSGLPGLSSNANLLPGLTDDMFVLEAPSFIVPYIYEKPPTDILKEVVKGIEMKYKLSREDLAVADKSDEFDMMTEQNKDDKEEKDEKEEKSGKKKRKRGDDGDESWSEESDEDEDDDDDDDSEAGMRTKVLIKEVSDDLSTLKGAIKPAAAVVQSTVASNTVAAKPGQENYFESPLGKFFMDIGVGLVQEFVQCDLIRLQKRKMRKSLGKNITEFERAISALSGNLDASKKKNAPFKFTMKRCEFCNFKSESALAMANHYETPHMNGPQYKCNFCVFEIRNATEIVYHMEAVHNIKARLIKPLPYHQCPNCGFEDNGKAKLARHQPVCAKKFRPELNLAPPTDWEAPAKIPRIKPRHGLVGTATAYQAMAAQAAAQKAALASIQQQQQVAQARSMQAAALAAQNAAKIRGRSPVVPMNKSPLASAGSVLRGPNQVRNPMATNVVLPNNYQLAGGQLIQTANALAKKSLTGQPSISITPLPRQSAAPQASSPSTSKMPPAGMKPGQSPGSGNKTQFVICEICDGYIKDLEQLRNHMQWMHKVKIHPKMIYNRPPLNCQKCQFRFFTDQGLERHLLGSHGLVTSSMQEAANKGKDAGRCPVCGRMYQWKLLNHVSRDHHMTLKPAHLSYKCTVCTATFGMYKQFETHVYTAHSTVAKKAMDGKKNNAPPSVGPSGSSGMQRNSLGMSNDSLLKPLKINDEITIIPQPASKPRITNMESHVID